MPEQMEGANFSLPNKVEETPEQKKGNGVKRMRTKLCGVIAVSTGIVIVAVNAIISAQPQEVATIATEAIEKLVLIGSAFVGFTYMQRKDERKGQK